VFRFFQPSGTRVESAMACRTVVVLSCLGLTAAIPKGSCTDASPESTTCCDVTDASNANCVKHVNWAMETGQPKHPHWYSVYGVSKGDASDTFANFQCALYLIGYNKAEQAKEEGFPAEQHGCPMPCSATVENGCAKPAAISFKKAEGVATCPAGSAAAAVAPALNSTICKCGPNATVVTEICPAGLECPSIDCVTECIDCPATPSSLAPWMIALIVILVLALAAGLACFLCLCMPTCACRCSWPTCAYRFSWAYGKSKKKKRAIKAPPAPAPVEPAPLPVQPMSYTMLPMPQPQPVQMVTMVAQPQPVQTIQYAAPPQPVQMVQQSMVQYAQPVQTTAVPMVQYAAPAVQQSVNLFDALDRNGDGVVTRAEMAQMGQFQQPYR